jgi:hypothetical protein
VIYETAKSISVMTWKGCHDFADFVCLKACEMSTHEWESWISRTSSFCVKVNMWGQCSIGHGNSENLINKMIGKRCTSSQNLITKQPMILHPVYINGVTYKNGEMYRARYSSQVVVLRTHEPPKLDRRNIQQSYTPCVPMRQWSRFYTFTATRS